MNSDFKDVMSKRTDEELIKIVSVDRLGYQPLAIEAAEEEIKNRNIDTTKIEQVKLELTTKIEERKEVGAKKVNLSTRFIHFIVDTVVLLILFTILTFPLNANDPVQLALGYLIFFISFIGYYIYMETKYQKTVGKFITKTSVINRNGTKPSNGNIAKRTFCRLIPFDRISYLFSQDGFHDRFSDTTVIRD